MNLEFKSRRSQVFGTEGMVATSQPLATSVGTNILREGGNAVDAAVAVAATLNITEPTSTGIGGDCFILYYQKSTKKVIGVNGSGRSPLSLDIERIKKDGYEMALPERHVHTITVPGAAAAWMDVLEKFGTMSPSNVFEGPIRLAKNGFPVQPMTSYFWNKSASLLKNSEYGEEMLINGRAPMPGELMRNPTLANTFEALVQDGKEGFYTGRIADAIIDLIQSKGGVMTKNDLELHKTEFVKPIYTTYKGVKIHEIPPNGQGITALIALNILKYFDLDSLKLNSAEYLHILIETMRLAFADAKWYVADPQKQQIPIEELLSDSYAKERRALVNLEKQAIDVKKGTPFSSSDTVYFAVTDKEGNACSFINSNYMGVGTGLIPEGCGFTLQNRGHNFSLEENHPNALAPGKRPYHTIIPGMATKKTELYAAFGVMGGFMQPQGHVQVISNLLNYMMDTQQALDTPRFCIKGGDPNGTVYLEDGIEQNVIQDLKKRGHNIELVTGINRVVFGRGQIIKKYNEEVFSAGTDPRADGIASPA